MINLKCPSCGGTLELPEDLKIAHCMYCGAKILLDEYRIKDSDNYENFIELSKSALDAKNYAEVIEYCNKILEINPKNVDAWVDKAEATFWLSTQNNQRYDEAIEYLSKAENISQSKEVIKKKKEEITNMQAMWLNRLGNEKFKDAIDFYERMTSGGLSDFSLRGVANQMEQLSRARKDCIGYFIEAMTLYISASNYAPSDMNILENILTCSEKADWISWSESSGVKKKLEIYRLNLEKEEAEKKIIKLQENLKSEEEKLEKVRKNAKTKGVLSKIFSRSEEDILKDIDKIKSEIEKKIEICNYEIPL